LGFAQSAGEGGACGVGCPVGAWDGVARARDGSAIKGDGVGVVCGDGVEGVLAQVLKSGVGVKVALAVSVVAVGDVVGVGVLGACELGDGFSCGGDEFGVGELLEGAVGFWSCGVEGCGADEVLEVVYWVCVVVLPIGLSHLGVSNTNRAVKVHKLLRMQNPPTPCPLPPCQGGRGSG
jgi:hypothetical protein